MTFTRSLLAVLTLALVSCAGNNTAERVDIEENRDSISLNLLWERLGDDKGRLNEHSETANSVENAEFSPDEKYIASVAKGDFTVRLWDAASGNELWRITTEGETEAVTFTRDGKYIIAGGEDKKIRAIDAASGKVIHALEENASIEGLRISSGGKLLATGNEAGQVKIWDISAADPKQWPSQPLFTLTHGEDQDLPGSNIKDRHSDVNQLDWSGNDSLLITAGRNGIVKLWNLALVKTAPGSAARELTGHPGTVKSVRLITGDSLAVSGSGQPTDGTAIVWDIMTGKAIARLQYPNMRILETVEFSPDGKIMLIGGTEREEIGTGRIYFYRVNELRNGNPEPFMIFPTYSQEYFYFSKDGSKLIVAGGDGGLRIFEVSTSK